MSTGDVARDMDLLRRAVGDDRLTYAGYSYGSILGAVYANLFPAKVRAVLVDGVVDPVSWTTGRDGVGDQAPQFVRIGSATGATDALAGFLRACGAAGRPACAFAAPGDERRKFDELMARLRALDPVLYASFVGTVFQVLYVPPFFDELAEILQRAYDETDPRQTAPAMAALAQRAAPYNNGREAQLAVLCADGDSPRRTRAYRTTADREDRQSPYFGRLLTWVDSPCATWPAVDEEDAYDGPFTRATAGPVLSIGTRYDPVTPFYAAGALDRLMPNARLLTVEGFGHTTLYSASGCALRTSTRFLVDGDAPERTRCTGDLQPFTDGRDAGDAGDAEARAQSDAARPVLPGPLAVR